MKAVIEEIFDDKVVLLLGEEEKEVVINKSQFAQLKDCKVGDWLDVKTEEGSIKYLKINREETEKVKKRIEDKMEKLRKRMDSK